MMRSADGGQLDLLRVRLSTYGGPAFGHAGMSAWSWNALPDSLTKQHTLSTFRRQLKHLHTSRSTSTPSAFEVIL